MIKIILTISNFLFFISLLTPSYTAGYHDKFFSDATLLGIEAYIYITFVGLISPFFIFDVEPAEIPTLLSCFFISISNILIPLSILCLKFKRLCKLYFLLIPIFFISVIIFSRSDFYASLHFGIIIWLSSMLLFSSIPFILYLKKEEKRYN